MPEPFLAEPSSFPPAITDLAAAITSVCPSTGLLAVILVVALHPCQHVTLQVADAHPCRRLRQSALPGRLEIVAEDVVYELVAEEQPQQVIQQEAQETQKLLGQQQDPAQGRKGPRPH